MHEATIGVLDILAILIFLAAVFSFVNTHWLKLPATIGLMTQSLVISLTIVLIGILVPEIRDSAAEILDSFDFSEVLMQVMLSFLLFAGAINVNFKKLVEEKGAILILATVGTLLSTFIIGFATFFFLPYLGINVELIYCLLFGALISPTDPIAVLAIVQKMNLSKNLQIKIEGESLFNDGVGVVIFLTILNVAQSGVENVTPIGVSLLFAQEVFGGILLGGILGYIGLLSLKYIDNRHTELEVLITLALVMGGTRIAELVHVSAPLIMVVLGIIIGREGKPEFLRKITGDFVYKFWHLIDEALNAILFILIGFEVLVVTLQVKNIVAGIIAIFVALFSRYISILIPTFTFGLQKSKTWVPGTAPILAWGGLRGGIAVALALALPHFAHKDLIVTMTYIIVVFSILIQGMTIKNLIRYLKLDKLPID